MTACQLLWVLALVGCSLQLDAGRLRPETQQGAGTAGCAGVVGGATPSRCGSGGEPSTAGAGGFPSETGSWSGPDLARLGFELLGSARLDQDRAVLTTDGPADEVGGIAQRDPALLGVEPALHIAVVFRIESTQPSGDGLAIVLHASPAGYSALGLGGGGLGYAALSPCIAVEVDVSQQVEVDPPTPHLAFMPGCNSERPGAFAPIVGDPTDDTDWRLTVDWDAQTSILTARLARVESEQEATALSEPTDLIGLLGERAFVAVTAATGSRAANHSIVSLQVVAGGLGARTVAR